MTLQRLLRRLGNVLRPGRAERDLTRELAAHLELLEEEYRRRGMSSEDAAAAARRALGSTALTMDLHRDARSFIWGDDLQRDVRYAIRTLRRTPGFTALAVATLAIGIGATAAIFTLVNDVLLRSLPVRDPRQLVILGDTRASGTAVGRQNGSFTLFSIDLYRRLREERLFDGLCAAQSSKSLASVRRAGAAASEPAFVRLVSTNYFDVLGTRPALGRLLGPADDGASAPPVAVISFRYWSERLNRDPSIVGSKAQIDRVPLTIVGVAAPEFYGETLEPDPPSFWIPLDVERQLDPSRTLADSPDVHWLYLIGRLGRGVLPPQAQARATAALQEWLRARAGGRLSPETDAAIGATHVELVPGAGGVSLARRNYASALQLLLAISAVVLLIACANIANLLLARGFAREAETSIRLAIGASRGRLIRQSLAESLTLALAGGAFGMLVAFWGVHLLLALVFSDTDNLPFSTTPDARVLAFTLALSCASALVFGVLPAIRGSAIVSPRHTRSARFGSALIVAQVALSLVVLAAAGALARSLANLAAQPFGFERERVLVVDVDPARAGYTYARLGPLYRELQARLSVVPGVTRASLSYYSPFDACCWGFTINAFGQTRPPEGRRSAMLNRVSAGYFETLGTKVVRGRAIDERDTPSSPRVAVVNVAFVRRFLADADPIGKRFSIGDGGVAGAFEIVGQVENAKYEDPRDDPRPMAFLALLQPDPDQAEGADEHQFIHTIEVRTAGDPAAVAGAVRQAIGALDPNLSVFRAGTLSDQVARALRGENVVATLAGVFGLAALALTCVGLYGLTAYGVQRRRREIGIRMALGADRAVVVRLIVREVLGHAAIGTVIGVPVAFAAMRMIESALYGVSPADVIDSSIAALVLLGSMLVAGYAPALRASRVAPTEALRYE
jgi:predicted permease